MADEEAQTKEADDRGEKNRGWVDPVPGSRQD